MACSNHEYRFKSVQPADRDGLKEILWQLVHGFKNTSLAEVTKRKDVLGR